MAPEDEAQLDFDVGREASFDGATDEARRSFEEYARLLRGRRESDRQLARSVEEALERLGNGEE